jgi:hypothetical protein
MLLFSLCKSEGPDLFLTYSQITDHDKSFDNVLILRHLGQGISRISLETIYQSPSVFIAPEISREEPQEKTPKRWSFIVCRNVLQDEHGAFVFAYANR